jgi:hypothetical protein
MNIAVLILCVGGTAYGSATTAAVFNPAPAPVQPQAINLFETTPSLKAIFKKYDWIFLVKNGWVWPYIFRANERLFTDEMHVKTPGNSYQGEILKPAKLALFLEDAPNYYKLHLMPKPEKAITVVEALIKELNVPTSELRNNISYIKIAPIPADALRKNYPLVALYAKRGKAHAQAALNRLYQIFGTSTDGLGITPRFNARVTDLIYIAQGDGDIKVGNFEQYFEPGTDDGKGRVYFKDSEKRGYLLTHPGTGKPITNNYTPAADKK